MRTLLLIFAACLWISPTRAHSQDEPSPRQPVVVEKAPDFCHWTVDFKYGGESSNGTRSTAPVLQGKKIARSEFQKTGNIKLERNSYEGGESQDIWRTGAIMVLKEPDYAHKIVRRSMTGSGDFPEFFWIKEAVFQGRERVEGIDCAVYRSELYPLQLSNPGLYQAEMASDEKSIDLGNKVPVVGYINVATKLPVKLVVDKDTRVYTYLDRPTAPLVMPPEYADAMADVDARYRALVKPLSKP